MGLLSQRTGRQKRAQEREKKGLCYHCGENKRDKGFKSCKSCRKKKAQKVVKKYKIQRRCKGCGDRIVVENANRYYCKKCRGY